MNSARPTARLDLLSILAVAVSVMLVPGPAAAQNEDTQREDVRKEDVRERGHLPEGFPAQQARPSGQVRGAGAPFGNLGVGGTAGAVERGAWASRAESNLAMSLAGSKLVMRAGAGLTGVGGFGGTSTSIADVDVDGNPDLLITGRDENDDPTATLYLGDGEGGFTEADAGLTGVGGFGGTSTSIADVDGDGNPDLLITGQDENLGPPTTTLYLGDGEGGFSEAGAGLTGVSDGSTSIADVDADGNPDLLITGRDENFDPTASLYLGDGEGGFTEGGAGLTGVQFSSTSIADIDGDGDLDLLVTGSDGLFGLSSNPSARMYINRQVQSPPNRAPTFARTLSYDRPLAPGGGPETVR